MRFIYSKLSSVLIKYSKVGTIRLKPYKTILLCYKCKLSATMNSNYRPIWSEQK